MSCHCGGAVDYSLPKKFKVGVCYWGVLVSILIFGVIYFFATLTSIFQGFSLDHDPNVVADTQLGEGMPIVGVGLGFYVSLVLIVLSFISASLSSI